MSGTLLQKPTQPYLHTSIPTRDSNSLQFFAHCPLHPNPLAQQTDKYTLADLTNIYKKIKHKRTKHILLELAYRKSQCFLFIIFHCLYLHLYLCTYYSIPIVQ